LLKRLSDHLTLLFRNSNHFEKRFFYNFGFRPYKPELYKIAFAHRTSPHNGQHNERLEFLGDAVLSNILAEILFNKFPKVDEGALTKMRSNLAKRSTLNSWSKELGIPSFLQHDPSLNHNPKSSETLYGNALEALLGAMFLDKGYYFTYNFLNDIILEQLVDFDTLQKWDTNYKSRLVEWSQQQGAQLDFHLDHKDESGSPPTFTVSTWINSELFSTAEGSRKKAAEQEAARKTLEKLQPELVS
jgi:ribonuclease-3